MARVCRLLSAHGVFDDTEMALPGKRAARGAADCGARGRARGRQPARRTRAAGDRSADREDGGGHDRAVRALRRDDGDLSRGLRVARTGLRGLGTHLGRQRAPERPAALLRGRRAREGGDPLLRPGSRAARRLPARRARRRPQPGEAGAAARPLRRRGDRRDARRQARAGSRVEARARRDLPGDASPFRLCGYARAAAAQKAWPRPADPQRRAGSASPSRPVPCR